MCVCVGEFPLPLAPAPASRCFAHLPPACSATHCDHLHPLIITRLPPCLCALLLLLLLCQVKEAGKRRSSVARNSHG